MQNRNRRSESNGRVYVGEKRNRERKKTNNKEKKNKTMKKMNMSENRIEDEGSEYIMKGMKVSKR